MRASWESHWWVESQQGACVVCHEAPADFDDGLCERCLLEREDDVKRDAEERARDLAKTRPTMTGEEKAG